MVLANTFHTSTAQISGIMVCWLSLHEVQTTDRYPTASLPPSLIHCFTFSGFQWSSMIQITNSRINHVSLWTTSWKLLQSCSMPPPRHVNPHHLLRVFKIYRCPYTLHAPQLVSNPCFSLQISHFSVYSLVKIILLNNIIILLNKSKIQ